MAREDVDTVVERPPTQSGRTVVTLQAETTSTVLRSEEAARARVFFRVTLAMGLAVALFVPFLPGDGLVQIVSVGICAATAIVSGGVLALLKDERRYTPEVSAALGVACASFAMIVLYYLGLFSAATMVLTVGIYFFGLSESARSAATVYWYGAVVYLLVAGGLASGVLPDRSLYPIDGVPVLSRWFVVVMAEVVFAMTFFLARSSKRATQVAIERAYRASLQVRDKEALLAEARVELDKALKPGEGRYTGQAIGDYRLGEVVGRGAMGEVYAAEHTPSARPVALKLLHPNVLEDRDQLRRFLREAEAAASVETPHVATILEVGKTPSGVPFIVMELLEGYDLSAHLRAKPRMRMPAVLDLVRQVAAGIAAVRDAGIVHRDLKPQNLFRTTTGIWKILDFGVSKVSGTGGTLTRGAVVGTPSYMSPEQARGDEVDHLSDLYSLACIAYRAITGKPAFPGNDTAAILYSVVYAQPPRPGELVTISPDVELVLAIGMAKRAADRFAKVEELAAALGAAAEGRLDASLRARGDALVREFPWGKSTNRASRTEPRSSRPGAA